MKKKLLTVLALAFTMGASAQVEWHDVTSKYMTNADFSNGKTGWTLTANGGSWAHESHVVSAIESYAGWGNLDLTTFSATQTVNLTAGEYKLNAYGFYRYGVSYDTDVSISNAQLFAGDKTQTLVTLGSLAEDKKVTSGGYANTMKEAANEFAAGNYKHTISFTVNADGEVELGVKGEHILKQSWLIVGPFSLEKYGYDVDDLTLQREELQALIEAGLPSYLETEAQAVLNENEEENFNALDQTSLSAAIKAVSDEVTKAKPIAELYSSVIACEAIAENSTCTDRDAQENFKSVVAEVKAQFDDPQTATATLRTANAKLEEARQAYVVIAKPVEGSNVEFDYTFLIAGVGDSKEGWTRSNANHQNYGYQNNSANDFGSFIKQGYMEVWNPSATNTVLTYTKTGLPEGHYRINAYAFTSAGNEVQFIANDKAVAVEAAGHYVQPELSDVVVYDDGTMTFGLNVINATWAGITHLQLWYQGELTDQDRLHYYAAVKAALDEARAVAETLDESYDSETFEAAIKEMEEQYESLKITNIPGAVSKIYDILEAAVKSQKHATGVDYTSAIRNNSFEMGDLTGWYIPSTSNDTGVRENANETYHMNNANGAYIFNTWWQGLPLSQIIYGLPAGSYKYTVSYASDEDCSFYLAANGEHSPRFDGIVKTEAREVSMWATVDATGKLKLSVSGAAQDRSYDEANTWYWYKVDNFKLVAVNANYNELQALLLEAGELTAGIDAADVPTALAAAVAEGNELVADDEATQEKVDKAAAALAEAIANSRDIIKNRLVLQAYIAKATALEDILAESNGEDYDEAYQKAVRTNGNIASSAIVLENAANTLAAYIDGLTAYTLVNMNFDDIPNVAGDSLYYNHPYLKDKAEVVQVYDIYAWDLEVEGSWIYGRTAEYGSTADIAMNGNSVLPPSADMFGNGGAALGLSAGWGAGNHIGYTRYVELPAGKYVLYYEVYQSNVPTVELSGTTIGLDGQYSDECSFTTGKWTSHIVEVDLETSGLKTLSVGITAGEGKGSGDNPILWIDNVIIYQYPTTVGVSAAEVSDADAEVDVYSISGVLVRKGVKAGNALNGLQKGIYIVNGVKRAVR